MVFWGKYGLTLSDLPGFYSKLLADVIFGFFCLLQVAEYILYTGCIVCIGMYTYLTNHVNNLYLYIQPRAYIADSPQ